MNIIPFALKPRLWGKAEHSYFVLTNAALGLEVPKDRGKHESPHSDDGPGI